MCLSLTDVKKGKTMEEQYGKNEALGPEAAKVHAYMTDKDRERVDNGFRECIDNAILSSFPSLTDCIDWDKFCAKAESVLG